MRIIKTKKFNENTKISMDLTDEEVDRLLDEANFEPVKRPDQKKNRNNVEKAKNLNENNLTDEEVDRLLDEANFDYLDQKKSTEKRRL